MIELCASTQFVKKKEDAFMKKMKSLLGSILGYVRINSVLHEQIDYRPKKEHKKPSKLQKQVWRVSVKFFRA